MVLTTEWVRFDDESECAGLLVVVSAGIIVLQRSQCIISLRGYSSPMKLWDVYARSGSQGLFVQL